MKKKERQTNEMINKSILSILRPGMIFNIPDPSDFTTSENSLHMHIILSYPNYFGKVQSVIITSKYGEYRLPIVINNEVSYVNPTQFYELGRNDVYIENFRGVLDTDKIIKSDDFINFIYEVNIWCHGREEILERGSSIEERFDSYIKQFKNLYGHLSIYKTTKVFKDESPVFVKVDGKERLGFTLEDSITKAMENVSSNQNPSKTTTVKTQGGGKKYIKENDKDLHRSLDFKYGVNPRKWEIWEKFERIYQMRIDAMEDEDLSFLLTIMNSVALTTLSEITHISYQTLYGKKTRMLKECRKRNKDRQKESVLR